VLAIGSLATIAWQDIDENFTFDQYLEAHPKSYKHGTPEYLKRKAIFQTKRTAVIDHNTAEHSWKKGLNDWSDMTQLEIDDLIGKKSSQDPPRSENFVEQEEEEDHQVEDEEEQQYATTEEYFKGLPKSIDWDADGIMSSVKTQCGGTCYAHTTAEILESGLAQTYGLTNAQVPDLSVQELHSCTLNPHHCGGNGQCNGATVELAMQWVQNSGLSLRQVFPLPNRFLHGNPYFATQMCPCRAMCTDSLLDKKRLKVKAESFTKLPKNKFGPLLKALTKGPVAIAVGADSWMDYHSGIANCLSADTTINHAVLLVGYGKTAKGTRYWKIRNSWGPNWGEKGYIRLLMKTNEHKFCGTNHNPKAGVACDNGPKTVPVCGTCGVLFDSVIVKGVHLVKDGKKLDPASAKKTLLETQKTSQSVKSKRAHLLAKLFGKHLFGLVEEDSADRDNAVDESPAEYTEDENETIE